MSGQLEPHRDHSPAESAAADGEIPRSWVYWSVGVGVALGLLIMLAAEVFPLPYHVHHLDIADAFNIAWKIALLPPGLVTARIAIDRMNLSKREHQHAVQVARSDEFDATQRRITELSAKASEQLGSDKAPVRIGGLSDLERLGQNNPDMRQTVIDRICAYLQMPYTMPGPEDKSPELRLEKQVRLTAQRILTRHTRWPSQDATPPVTFWEAISLDLSDATLFDFNMSGCRLAAVRFARAAFHGPTELSDMRIDQTADFYEVKFDKSVLIYGTVFGRDVAFGNAKFGGYAGFIDVSFDGSASFYEATFGASADFAQASFAEHASFISARFNWSGGFDQAVFQGSVAFGDAKFGTYTSFRDTTFSNEIDFRHTRFSGNPDFAQAEFGGNIILGIPGSSSIRRIRGSGGARLKLDPASGYLTVRKDSSPPDVPRSHV